MSADPTVYSMIERGRLLREHGRHEEAEHVLLDAIRLDPDNPHAYCELALSRLGRKARLQEALEAMDRAISLRPEEAYFHAVRSLVLHDAGRHKEALAQADAAVTLDPDELLAHIARAHALCAAKSWAEAEAAVRRALEIDPDSSIAHNLLSVVLRQQNRREEDADQIRRMLERNPDDADTHANAGWNAIHSGDRAAAQKHFLEALRLEPENETARSGLLEAYRSRMPPYRLYLRYCLFMSRLTTGRQWVIIIGLYVGYRLLRSVAAVIGPFWAIAAGVIYALLVLWSHLARSVGNALILCDRIARHALRLRERIDGMVGGMVLTGALLGLAGAILSNMYLAMPALLLLLAAVPLSKVTLNDSVAGRRVFGAIACLPLISGVLLTAALIWPNLRDAGMSIFVLATIGTAVSTFLGGVSALNR